MASAQASFNNSHHLTLSSVKLLINKIRIIPIIFSLNHMDKKQQFDFQVTDIKNLRNCSVNILVSSTHRFSRFRSLMPQKSLFDYAPPEQKRQVEETQVKMKTEAVSTQSAEKPTKREKR